ncbi:MAG: carboxylating nicotinate-nucleotide diphosphorylase [Isosphaeraceae bacterium]
MNSSQFQFGPSEARCADALVAMALAEDLGQAGDITSAATIPSQAIGTARFVARAPGVLAGLPVIVRLLEQFQLASDWKPHRSDGHELERGTVIAELGGSLRSILALERTALNFLQRLSGIATLTARFVAAVQGTRAVILDTRKTTPGLRTLEKYAVRCGGGRNHRMGLFDAVLIKDNHLAFLQSQGRDGAIAAAIAAARAHAPGAAFIEVEVDSLEQFEQALACKPDIILLDNLGPETLASAVRRRDEVAPEIKLEASGGVNIETVAALARTGVDRISAGALTHSAPALDIALDFQTGPS